MKGNAMNPVFILPQLPYTGTALEPYISANTLGFHHGKHHKAYVDKANSLIEGTQFQGMTPEEIILKTAGNSEHAGIFNNAAQAWNHSFYWNSMRPSGGGSPSGKLAGMINAAFGSFEHFKQSFTDTAVGQFGSGWAWLVLEKDALKIIKTGNAETPISKGMKPLITVDVWEHAYYLDFQNRRPDYIKAFLDHLVNWDFALKNLG